MVNLLIQLGKKKLTPGYFSCFINVCIGAYKKTGRLGILFIFLWPFLSCKKQPAFLYTPKPQLIIKAGDSRWNSNLIHFVKDTVYIIADNINVSTGKTLLLDAGTLVKVAESMKITIQSGAIIESRGTASEPVVFTVNARKGNAGASSQVSNEDIFWAGFTILGNANGKSSGIVTYTRLEFAGAVFNSALLLSGVNRQTIINNIQVSYASGNAFDFNGGDCNAFNLLSYATYGTDFYTSNGYTGKLQHLLCFKDPELGSDDDFVGGLYIGGAGTAPAVSNLTIMRPGLKQGLSSNYTLGEPKIRGAVIVRNGANFHIRNAVIIGLPATRKSGLTDTFTTRAFYLQSYNSAASLDSGKSDFSYSAFYQSDSNAFYIVPRTYQNYNSADLRTFLVRPQYHNEIFSRLDQFNFNDPYSYNYYYSVFSPLLHTGSPLLTGADFNDPAGIFKDSFFKPVAYRGALGTENWLQGWANFSPLQTNYNN